MNGARAGQPPDESFSVLQKLGVRARAKIPYVQQHTAAECGVACLAMVLEFYGKFVPREEIRQVLGSGRDGVSAKTLLRGAEYFGLVGRGLRLELDSFKHLSPGAILHWGFNHFVVFEGPASDGVYVVDPAFGPRRVPRDELDRSFTGVALALEPSEHFEPQKSKRHLGARLLRLLWSSGAWARIVVTSALLQILALALPLLTSTVVDRVVPRGDRHLLVVAASGIAGILIFHYLTTVVRAHLLLNLRVLFEARMTLALVRKLLSLPFAFFQQRSTGDLNMRLNNNAVVREIVTAGAVSAALDGALMVVYLALMSFVDLATFALVLALGALQAGVFLASRRRMREVEMRLVDRRIRYESYQYEMIAGVETIKAMGCEGRVEERWSDLFVDVLNASLLGGRVTAQLDSLSGTLRTGAPLLIFGVGTLHVLDGAFTLGTMLALNAFAIGVFTPLSSLVSTALQFERLGSYFDRLNDVHETPAERALAEARPPGKLRGRVKVERVSFRYSRLAPLVVDDVSVEIEPGQFVAIVGKSGSGKSSLAGLLLGLHAPTEGRVLYDGQDLADVDVRSVRRQLGIVTQRAYIFGTTIRANIAVADPDLSLEAVIAAAKAANVHEDIERMPMGYDTLLTDGGGSLSGGQRQRLALARALVRKPAILLLDEATSALDAITERHVQGALAQLSCTRVVIAHRLSTVVAADVILVMDGGKIVERGRHEELLARSGTYARLIASQLDGKEPAAKSGPVVSTAQDSLCASRTAPRREVSRATRAPGPRGRAGATSKRPAAVRERRSDKVQAATGRREQDIMRVRKLGVEGPSVGAIGLGCVHLSFGERPDEAQALEVIHSALDAGVTLFDTADVYCLDDGDIGHNERLLAKALRRRSERALVATKGGMRRPRGAWVNDARPEQLRTACEASLRALDVETIDLYQLHAPDRAVPFLDSVGELARLREAGKIRFVGLSNVTVKQIEDARSVVPVASVQNRYSPQYRAPERDGTLAHCEARGIAYLSYSPFGGVNRARALALFGRLADEARARGVSPQGLTLAWMLAKSPVLIPIPGARQTRSIRDSAAAANLNLGPADVEAVERSFMA